MNQETTKLQTNDHHIPDLGQAQKCGGVELHVVLLDQCKVKEIKTTHKRNKYGSIGKKTKQQGFPIDMKLHKTLKFSVTQFNHHSLFLCYL